MNEWIDHRHQRSSSPVSGIPPAEVVAAYEDRKLDRLSDEELASEVASVIAEPREGPADSFVLHAPLELIARTQLLAQTPQSQRRIGRLRLLSIAARYELHPSAQLRPAAHGAGGEAAERWVDAAIDAIAAGDLDEAERSVRQMIASTDLDLGRAVHRLAAAIGDRTAAAAHGPILFATLASQPARARQWLRLARPLVRELAREPGWRLRWMASPGEQSRPPFGPDGLTGQNAAAARLGEVLSDPPRLGVPGSTFIHPLLMQVDAPGVAEEFLRPAVNPTTPVTTTTARTITRVAALAMLDDDPEHAPYGWTHCLTLPQAILTLAPVLQPAGVPALAIAATHSLAFRAALGSHSLDLADPRVRPADPATLANRRRALIVEAARRHDAHIAKYVLAVLTEAERDREASELYLRAGEHLLGLWDGRGPDPDDILADAVA